ncbi:MAG TPA: anthranilate synthase component 1 [Allosphingosinicella sp.]|nr:anthranilate synthase component 1 [Allosphingosinicella sp.]
MSATPIGAGQALALQRRLDGTPDRLALYAALSDGGRRKDTLLLERAVGPSLLMDQAALRVSCHGHRVELAALSDGGRNILSSMAERLGEYLTERSDDALVFTFPQPSAVDARERLLAPSPFDVLRALTGLSVLSSEEPFTLACLGVLAYDHVDLFESLPQPAEDRLQFPDFIFWIAESLIVFDPGAKPRAVCTAFGAKDAGEAQRAYFGAAERLAALVKRCEAARGASIEVPKADPKVVENPDVDLDDTAYRAVVARMKEHINRGDIYQVVPSRTFSSPCPDPLRAFAMLRRLDPSPYQFFVAAPRHLLFGCSPETAVRVFDQAGKKAVEVKPIAGTRKRGATEDEDDRMEAEMRLDHKETAEHMMLVDLARNDVARVSVPGSRRVASLMSVERYARLMHLVSSVVGRLRPGLDALHALQACLNVGTLTGAPKIRATELLRENERTKRGPYGGAIGWLNGEGHMDTGIVIRSAVVMDGTAYVRAGGGVVYDSDPQLEANESRRKASAVLSALAAAGEER